MTPPTPNTLRAEAAGWRMRQHFATADLLDAAADAWGADLAHAAAEKGLAVGLWRSAEAALSEAENKCRRLAARLRGADTT